MKLSSKTCGPYKSPTEIPSKSSANSKARKEFWAGLTGKSKQSSSISAVQASDGVIKCEDYEIKQEVEKHLCSVFQGSMDSFQSPDISMESPSDHQYFTKQEPRGLFSDHCYGVTAGSRLPSYGNSAKIEENASNWLGSDFSTNEIKFIASQLNNGKAYGWDNIPSEFLKMLQTHFSPYYVCYLTRSRIQVSSQ